jgi:hypothetical protein
VAVSAVSAVSTVLALGASAQAQTPGGMANPAVGAPSAIAVTPATPSTNPDQTPKPERRSGLVIGGTGLFATGTADGYPNEAAKIGDPTYYGAGGAMAGGGGTAFVMGALADVFNFGLYFGYTLVQNNDWASEGFGGGFRLEAFPLYSLVPKLRDLGAFAQFGIGSANLEPLHGAYPGADGVQSHVSVGVFYEWTLFHMLGGHMTLGPSVEFDYVTARSIERSTLGVGLRVAFYGGPK